MKIQLEQLDLLHPWPRLALRDGYHAVRVLVRIGNAPVGEVTARPVRRQRELSHRRLRRRIARSLATPILTHCLRLGMAAGPGALQWLVTGAWGRFALAGGSPGEARRFVEESVLLPTGLPAPVRDWASDGDRPQRAPLPPITVAVCTRDREDVLEACLIRLRELDYPSFEVLVVDHSRDPVPTRDIADRCGARYVRCGVGGLSRARNAALANATHEWVAFTEDDCRPEKAWLRELATATRDPRCRAASGLVLPARLDSAAEVADAMRRAAGRTYEPAVFDPGTLRARRSRAAVASAWGAAPGAGLLVHVAAALKIGGFDIDLGPGPHSVGGRGQDHDLLYRLLRARHHVHYVPSAVVQQSLCASPKALRKQVRDDAAGMAAYHARCALLRADYRSLLHLACGLPIGFARDLLLGMTGRTKYPFTLVLPAIRGTLEGPLAYAGGKVGRLWQEWRHPEPPGSWKRDRRAVTPSPATAPQAEPGPWTPRPQKVLYRSARAA